MIKFFRNIRQNLLMEEKTGKYLKYAIGEIILVVLGILIALQINNWNENRLINKEVNTYLNNLTHEFLEEQETLDAIIKYHSFKYYSMQYLLKIEGSNLYDPVADRKNDIPKYKPESITFWSKEIPENYDKEFIQLTIGWMHRAIVPPFSKSTLEELKSTGMYSKINPSLKKEINLYYLYMENDFNGKPQSLALDFQASLADDGFISTDTYKLTDPISLIRNNPKRIGLIKRMIRESGWTIQSAIQAKASNESLIKLIKKELAK